MKQINYIFYSVLFIGFFLPSNSIFHISIAGAEIQIREIAFLLLPVINLFCYSKNKVKVADKKIQYLILFFIGTIIVTELLKHMYYGGGIGSTLKTIRIGLPLFSCFLILFFGIRANIEKVWRTLLWAVSASAVLTLITPFVHLPIYPTIEGGDFIQATAGRFINANASFGIIGIYLLYRDQERWYNTGWLPRVTAILGVIILIVTFNRTYLALLALAFVYLSFSEFSFKSAIKYVSIPLFALGAFYTAYNYSDVVQRQVDNRILSIVLGETELVESVYVDNRDQIYFGVRDRIKEGYWLFGLPDNKPIFYWYRYLGVQAMSTTDTSFVNIFLRYGAIPLILFLFIFLKLYQKSPPGIVPYTFIVFSFASLNVDSLLRHNSILFLTILLFVAYHGRK